MATTTSVQREAVKLEAQLRQAEQQQRMAQESVSLVCNELPVPFTTSTALPVDVMVHTVVDAFRRARRAKMKLDDIELNLRSHSTVAPATAALPPTLQPSDVVRSSSVAESEPGGHGRRQAQPLTLADEAHLRVEMKLLRKRLVAEEECSELVDRLRGLAITKATLVRERMVAAANQYSPRGEGDDDGDFVEHASSGLDTAWGNRQVDFFIGSRHAIQTRSGRRRRGHNTLAHAVEQAKLGYGGVALRGRHALPLNVSRETLELERSRLAEAQREYAALFQLLQARLVAREAMHATHDLERL
jgi:hypothetical protein